MNSQKILAAGLTLFFAFAISACGTVVVTNDVGQPETSAPDAPGDVDNAKPPGETKGPQTKAPLSKTPSLGVVQPVSEEDLKCETDTDCVAAECCHAKTCVNKTAAPNCEGFMCTMDCRGGTMDCGGGKCVCQDGKCSAKMNPSKIPGGIKPPDKVE